MFDISQSLSLSDLFLGQTHTMNLERNVLKRHIGWVAKKRICSRKKKKDDIWNIKKSGRVRGLGPMCRPLNRKWGEGRAEINEELTVDRNIL